MLKFVASDGKDNFKSYDEAIGYERELIKKEEERKAKEKLQNKKKEDLLAEIESLRDTLNSRVKEYGDLTNTYPVFYGINNQIGKIDFCKKKDDVIDIRRIFGL